MKLWLRPLPFALLAGYVLARTGRAPIDDAAPSRSAALCKALEHQGVTCAPEDVVWTTGPSGITGAIAGEVRALFRGREKDRAESADPGAPSDKNETIDLFTVGARLSPEGHLLDVGDAHNLTHTSGADEGAPVLHGTRVAYVVSLDGRPEAVHVLDLAGHAPRAYEELSRFQRFQVGVADLQATGQSRGVKRTVYALVPPPSKAALSFRPDGKLEVKTESRTFVVDPVQDSVVDGTAFVRVTPEVVAKPPTFAPWMSDRLRAVSWFGDEKNQILKALVFTALEHMKGLKSRVTGDTGEKDATADLEALGQGQAGTPKAASFTDPEIGWPPKALEPLLKPPITGEGQWIPLEKDAFITPIPGIPAPFLTTFVRGDPAAPHTRVYVTLWDPRLVSLHMEAGTVEPVSATGEAGPGQIPRTPEVMRHVVAGFNGGFQATHGEFGMQANGTLYLPPKPYGATVMELRDGTTGFGSWPRSTEVPDEVLSFRQNMTAIVQNDKYNPWGRTWWGGVPPGWHDAIHTTRSGLCLTKEGYVAYFWGNDIGPEPLGRAMLVARCAYGIHLDMNPGLAGFEFYNVQPASSFQPLGRPLQTDWEYEGTIKDLPDFKFRARRMVKSMGHILFPRYIGRDARDFFYLTARSVLPGTPIGNGEKDGEAGNWRVKGLPQHGYPYAVAITSTRLGVESQDPRVHVLRVDPRTVVADTEVGAIGEGNKVVAVFGRAARPKAAVEHAGGGDRRHKGTAPPRGAPDTHAAPAGGDPAAGGLKLWLGPHVFAIDKTSPRGATAIADVLPPAAPGAGDARAAVGISDEDGMLQWIELLPEEKADARSAEAMLKMLQKLGCSARGLVVGDVRAFLGGSLDTGGQPAAAAVPMVRLVRTPAPGAKAVFEDNEIVPASVWSPLQSQRVKWRPTKAPPEQKPAGSGSAAAPAPPTTPK
ncbi:MAG: hypothetical protein JST00_22555 [Deltaproteobacteria bacterium]|nr:hypothetical protein [Deltaproteobacteria bacterium]